MRRLRRRLGGREWVEEVPLTLVSGAVAAAVLSPLLWLFVRAGEVGLDRSLSLAVATSDVLVTSVALAACVTAGSLLLGVPLAFLTARTDLPFRRGFTVLLALPLVVPSYIGAFAFHSATGTGGVLSTALGVEVPEVRGFVGTVFVLTLYVYPYVFLTTRATLLAQDATLVEAARTLGEDRWGAFRRVTLPRLLPGVAAGALLVALYTLSDFGTPAILGSEVFTREIFVEYNTFGRDRAALLSLQLLAVTAVVIAIESRVGTADASAYASKQGQDGSDLPLGRWKLPATLGALAVAGVALVAPVGILSLWLVRGGPGYAAGGFAFEWIYAFNSVAVAAATAAVAGLAALPVGYLAVRDGGPLARLFERATYVGFAVPGVVLGLALVYFGTRFAPALYQTIPLLIFAYVVRFLPQAVGTTRSSVLQVDAALVEAARTLGEPPVRAFRRVTLPLVAPGVAAGAALVFLTTMKELPATLLLRPTEFESLVTYIWTVEEAGYYGRAALPALLLVAVSAVSMLAILARERYDVGD